MNKHVVQFGYILYCLSAAVMSYYVIFHRLVSEQGLSDVEIWFILPGMFLIGGVFPGPHSGAGVFPAVVISNSFVYLAMPVMVREVARRTASARITRQLWRPVFLFALWMGLALIRGRVCMGLGGLGLDDGNSWWWSIVEMWLKSFGALWWLWFEGIVVAVAAWLASDWITPRLVGVRQNMSGQASAIIAVAVVIAWSLGGTAICNQR